MQSPLLDVATDKVITSLILSMKDAAGSVMMKATLLSPTVGLTASVSRASSPVIQVDHVAVGSQPATVSRETKRPVL